jgi:hypothetical protein
MKTLLFFAVLFLSSVSCQTKNSDGHTTIELKGNEKTIVLQEGVGKILLYIPPSYDTSFSWTHLSDCGKPCDKIKIRFQPRNNKVFKESGTFWVGPTNQVEQLTVSYPAILATGPVQGRTLEESKSDHSSFILGIKNDNSNPPIVLDTMEMIQGRVFSIAAMEKREVPTIVIVLANTVYKGNDISFRYEMKKELDNRDVTPFIKNSIRYLKTVRFE